MRMLSRMFSRILCLSVALSAALAFATRASAEETWRLAGAFNNWNAADEDWTLTPQGDDGTRFLIERPFVAGTCTFKFVKDGDWSKGALAKGPATGSLIETGENLTLRIPGDGTYRLTLNPQARTWSWLALKADRTIFDARMFGPAVEGRAVLLDFSRTLTIDRWDRSMLTYEAPSERLGTMQSLDRYGRRVRLTLSGAGPMTLTIKLTDAAQILEKNFSLNVEPEAVLRFATSDDRNNIRGITLEPVAPGVRRTIVSFAKDTDLFAVEVSAGEGEIVRTENSRIPAGTYAVEVRDGSIVTQRDPALPLMFLPGNWRIFAFTPTEPADTVHLSGDFNRWARPGRHGAIELASRNDGSFFTIINLPLGQQRYRYIIDGSNDAIDPTARTAALGPGGTPASVALVGPAPKEFPAPQPNAIDRAAFRHDPASALDFSPISRAPGLADISLTTLPGDVTSVTTTIEVASGTGRERKIVPLTRETNVGGFDRWSARVMTSEPRALYSFTLTDGSDTFTTPAYSASIEPALDLPPWAMGAAWCQIQPDLSADKGLRKITKRLAALRELGVTAVVVGTIFDAHSAQQPDAPDRAFFDNFLPAARKANLRVVIDAAFDHTRKDSLAFRDLETHGTQSPYKDWFFAKFDDTGKLKSWESSRNNPAFPKFRQQPDGNLAPPVKDHLFTLTRRFMDPDSDGNPADGIDGWRLDSPLDIGLPFWREWRILVKSINPDALIIADIQDDASPNLAGDTFDAQTHRPFAKHLADWLGARPGMTARALEVELNKDFDDAPQTNLIHQNPLTRNDNKPTRENDRRAALGLAFQSLYTGAPMIDDTDDRPDTDLHKDRDRWLQLRADPTLGPVLRFGSTRHLDSGDPNVFAFERSLNGVRLAAVINRQEQSFPTATLRLIAPGGPSTIDPRTAKWWIVTDH